MNGAEPHYDMRKDDLERMRFVERLTIKQIAAHYGSSVRTVNKRLKQHGLLKNKTHSLDGEELAGLYNNGMTFRDLSKMFDAPYYTLWLALEGTSVEKRGSHRRVGTFVGPDSPIWQGGRRENNGYVRVLVSPGVEVAEHRLVMEEVLGRPLHDDEHVHHIDFDGLNNDPSNLMAMWPIEHSRLHSALRRNPNLDQRQWLENYRALENKDKWRALAA